MVTGDQDRTEPDEVVESESLHCSCEWATADTGNHFFAKIIRPDPDCPVHKL